MRTIYISHINHSKTKRSLFGKFITDYDTHEGIVREVAPKTGDRAPKYRIKSTRESVNVIII